MNIKKLKCVLQTFRGSRKRCSIPGSLVNVLQIKFNKKYNQKTYIYILYDFLF